MTKAEDGTRMEKADDVAEELYGLVNAIDPRARLEKMCAGGRQTLVKILERVLKEIEKVNWDEERPRLVERIKKRIEKYGVSLHLDECILEYLRTDPLFDVNEISASADIRARGNGNGQPIENTAEFERYSDSSFAVRFDPPEDIDFSTVYRGEELGWSTDEGLLYTAPYNIRLYAVTKKFDLAKLPVQVPFECFIMDEWDTKEWIRECTVTCVEPGLFKVVAPGKEWTASLDSLRNRCYERFPIF